MNSQDNAIATRDLSKSYGKIKALHELNLTVPRHSIFGFLGPNGAGKTTTIKLLLGLAKPSAGNATIFGQDIRRESIPIRRRIGYLAQNPRFYPHMTARQTLTFTARFFYDTSSRGLNKQVAETLDLVGLSDKADRPIKGFSGGELQRLGIGQAQVNHPDLLILDEPAASLDPMGRHDVLEVMQRLRHHTTIFYSTHILDDVQRVADTVAILNHGELVRQAPVNELLADESGLVFAVLLQGDAAQAQQRVTAQPWVRGIEVSELEGQTAWRVSVTDSQVAKQQLLRLILADQSLTVLSFTPQQHTLEESFLQMVGENKNV